MDISSIIINFEKLSKCCEVCGLTPCGCPVEVGPKVDAPMSEPIPSSSTEVAIIEPEENIGAALAELTKLSGIQSTVKESILTEYTNITAPFKDRLIKFGHKIQTDLEEFHKNHPRGEFASGQQARLNRFARIAGALVHLGEPVGETALNRLPKDDLEFLSAQLKMPYEKFKEMTGLQEGVEMRPYQGKDNLEPMSKKQVMGDQPLVNNTGDNSMVDPEHDEKKLTVKTVKENFDFIKSLEALTEAFYPGENVRVASDHIRYGDMTGEVMGTDEDGDIMVDLEDFGEVKLDPRELHKNHAMHPMFEEPSEPYANEEHIENVLGDALENFDMQEFLEHCGSDFGWEDRDSTPEDEKDYSTQYILSSLKGYLEHWIELHRDEHIDLETTDVTHLFKVHVLPFLTENGYHIAPEMKTVEGTVDEAKGKKFNVDHSTWDKTSETECPECHEEPCVCDDVRKAYNAHSNPIKEDNGSERHEDNAVCPICDENPCECDDDEKKKDLKEEDNEDKKSDEDKEPTDKEPTDPAVTLPPAAIAAPATTPAAVAAAPAANSAGSSDTSRNRTNTETGGSSPGGASTGGSGKGSGGGGGGAAPDEPNNFSTSRKDKVKTNDYGMFAKNNDKDAEMPDLKEMSHFSAIKFLSTLKEHFTYGDKVEITGDKHHHGDVGEIVSFDKSNDTVVVDLKDHGRHSFPIGSVEKYNIHAEENPVEAMPEVSYKEFAGDNDTQNGDFVDLSDETMSHTYKDAELYFVKNGNINGIAGIKAMTIGVGEQQKDGWYYMMPKDEDGHGPFATVEDTKVAVDNLYNMEDEEVDEGNSHDDLRATKSDHDTLMRKNIQDAKHQDIVLDEVDAEDLGTENSTKELTDKIMKLDDKNYVEVCHLLFPAAIVYKPHDKNDIFLAVSGLNYEKFKDVKNRLDHLDASITEEKDEELKEKAPPGMEKWVKANKSKFKKEYGKDKGTEILYKTAWKKSNEAIEKLEQKLTEEYNSFE